MLVCRSRTGRVEREGSYVVDIEGICAVLKGRIRGNPVAVMFFEDEVPGSFDGVRVEPCGILRYAMDDGRRVYTSREFGDCLHGTYLLGLDEGNDLMQTGRILTDYMPMYTPAAAKAVNSGEFRLPLGTVRAVGAAPLDDVPAGLDIMWIVVVCTPKEAALISAARSVKDGVMPSSAAGNSFCTDAFVTPWYQDNVVITPGDYGGRTSNRLRPEELFVIIPTRYADNLIAILDTSPDILGIYEATRPSGSEYWKKKAAREQRARRREQAEKHGQRISMDWDDDALAFVARAPKFVRRFAVGRVEDFAVECCYERVTLAVVDEQMARAGTRANVEAGRPSTGDDSSGAEGTRKRDVLGRLFRR